MRRLFSAIDANNSAVKTQRPNAPKHCIADIQTAWAEALRCDFERNRETLLCKLAATTQEYAINYPNDAKVMLWNGVVLAGYARSLGGLAGLALLQHAKTSLEDAIQLAPNDGAAYLYLGFLYESAPESPYGFGNEAMAKKLLEQGLALTLPTQKSKRAG